MVYFLKNIHILFYLIGTIAQEINPNVYKLLNYSVINTLKQRLSLDPILSIQQSRLQSQPHRHRRSHKRQINSQFQDVIQDSPEVLDLDQLKFLDGNETDYDRLEKIGEGAFSNVYLGKSTINDEMVVLKVLKEIRQRAINREISVLKQLQGASPYIVQMKDAIRFPQLKTATLVYEYMESVSFISVAFQMNLNDVKFYLFQLLLALDASHSRGVMHRDIKMTNIIVNLNQRKLLLIDWGLADYYSPLVKKSTRVGTKQYKAPELFLGFQYYDYAVDMWGFGCVLGGLTLRKHPLFKGNSTGELLGKITKLLGSDDMYTYMEKYQLTITDEDQDQIIYHQSVQWRRLKNKRNINMATDEALDLLSNLLVYDHTKRYTAKQALSHSYFDSVRRQFK